MIKFWPKLVAQSREVRFLNTNQAMIEGIIKPRRRGDMLTTQVLHCSALSSEKVFSDTLLVQYSMFLEVRKGEKEYSLLS